MVNMDDIQNTLRFKEQSQQPYKSCLIQNQTQKAKKNKKTLAALLNNAHGSKMRDSFTQGQVTVRVLINNDQDPFLCLMSCDHSSSRIH